MRPQAIRQLLLSNRGRGFFRAEAKQDEATLYLYDIIVSDDVTAEFWGGISPEAFAKAIGVIEAPTIHLRINSPGGDVFAARAIEQAVRQHASRVVTHVDGYAASAASIIAIAGDEVEIAKGGFFMIHESWTFAFGNASDLLETAALLEKVDGTLAQTYAEETGQQLEDVVAWMAAETWFTGEEAVEKGFADRLAVPAEKTKAAAAWDLSAYARAPATARKAASAAATPRNTSLDMLRRKLDLRSRCIAAPR